MPSANVRSWTLYKGAPSMDIGICHPARSQASSDQRLPHLLHIHFDLHHLWRNMMECTCEAHITTSTVMNLGLSHWQLFLSIPCALTVGCRSVRNTDIVAKTTPIPLHRFTQTEKTLYRIASACFLTVSYGLTGAGNTNRVGTLSRSRRTSQTFALFFSACRLPERLTSC